MQIAWSQPRAGDTRDLAWGQQHHHTSVLYFHHHQSPMLHRMATYALNICLFMNSTDPAFARNATSPLLHVDCLHVGINDQKIAISRVSTMRRTTDHRPLISPQLASARPRKMGWKLNWYFATALNVGFDPSPLQTDDQWSPAASITISPQLVPQID